MTILFLQTAEATYRPLLDATAPTVREYCARHGCSYESYFGIVRGYHPWQATYNRIPLLQRLLDAGHSGWVCYLDADAYIADLDFDLRGWLSDKDDISLVIAHASPNTPWWNVNAGVFLINLGHPVGHEIVREWSRRFGEIEDEQLRTASRWSQTKDDQRMLQELLQDMPDAQGTLIGGSEAGSLINYGGGRFIKQVLRVAGDLDKRAAHLKAQVTNVLGQATVPLADAATAEGQTHEAFVRALYRVLLLREPDAGGLAHGLRLVQGGSSFEQAMRSCMNGGEFAGKRRQFTETYLRDKPPAHNLTTLANKYGSDKGTRRGAPPHKYTYLYDLIFDRYRDWAIDFLELGLAVGGPEVGGPVDRQVDSPSVQMWLDYFPRAHIYGFDISDFSRMRHPRFTFVRGDGGSPDDMRRLAGAAPSFDVIIDDGSHASYHQQLAFLHLFPKLRPGGTYVIEDLQWQSPTYEGKPIALPKTRDFMIGFFEGDKYLPNELLPEEFMRAAKDAVASFAWFPAFSGAASPAKVLVLRKTG